MPPGKASLFYTVPCKHFAQGKCKRGDNCTFIHDQTSWEATVAVKALADFVGAHGGCIFASHILDLYKIRPGLKDVIGNLKYFCNRQHPGFVRFKTGNAGVDILELTSSKSRFPAALAASAGEAANAPALALASFVAASGGRMKANKVSEFYKLYPEAREAINGKISSFCERHPGLLSFEVNQGDGVIICTRTAEICKARSSSASMGSMSTDLNDMPGSLSLVSTTMPNYAATEVRGAVEAVESGRWLSVQHGATLPPHSPPPGLQLVDADNAPQQAPMLQQAPVPDQSLRQDSANDHGDEATSAQSAPKSIILVDQATPINSPSPCLQSELEDAFDMNNDHTLLSQFAPLLGKAWVAPSDQDFDVDRMERQPSAQSQSTTDEGSIAPPLVAASDSSGGRVQLRSLDAFPGLAKATARIKETIGYAKNILSRDLATLETEIRSFTSAMAAREAHLAFKEGELMCHLADLEAREEKLRRAQLRWVSEALRTPPSRSWSM
mmetsp:Transcript_40375/g.73131  ORF Transcript_40375/g.73131 Transcript_40375/m.73131 type:complete len:498 (-) Transcript_40375:49-1542(-)